MIHTQPGRHRLHRLALAVEHQPAQIQLTRGPLIRPWQFAEHLGGESHQTRPDLGHLLWSHEPSQDHTTGHKPGSDTPNKALLVPGQSTFALLMVSARRMTLRSLGSVTCRFRQAM